MSLHAAGELVPPLGVLDAVEKGSVEAGHTASYFYIGKNPAFGFHTAMPFGLSLWAQNAWLYEGGGQALIDEFTSHAHWSKFRAEQSMWQQFCDLPFDNMMAGLLRSKA